MLKSSCIFADSGGSDILLSRRTVCSSFTVMLYWWERGMPSLVCMSGLSYSPFWATWRRNAAQTLNRSPHKVRHLHEVFVT